MPKIKKRKKEKSVFQNKPTILIGADPELFLYNKKALKWESVHSYIKDNDKWNPLVVPRGAIQADGVAAEFNISPAKDRKEWMHNLDHVQKLLALYISNQNEDIALVAAPTVYFEQAYFEKLPGFVKELGCNPDFNAYSMIMNEKPKTDLPMRTGAGHVHIGWMDIELTNPMADEHFLDCAHLTRKLDWMLYNSSLMWDMDTQRRNLYGAPGAFRPKKYGLEYRVLSSAWLNSPRTKMFVYDATKAITNMHLANSPLDVSITPEKNSMETFLASVDKQHLPNIKSYVG